MQNTTTIRAIAPADCTIISAAFRAQGWDKPSAQYERYLALQASAQRDVLLLEVSGEFAGYLTINWRSDYPPFRENNIPEIVDFNVLKRFQRRGLGTLLMDEAERRIKRVAPLAGIGFGVYQDYGPAQILYAKRGYLPDGRGLSYNAVPVKYGDQVIVDDGLVMHLLKEL